MKKSVFISFFVISIIVFNSSSFTGSSTDIYDDDPNKLKMFSWLIGVWENKSADKIYFERWEQVNDSVFEGISYVLAGNDTISFESIQIAYIDGNVYYIPIVKGQNDGKPVVFQLKNVDSSSCAFENNEHDFPTLIQYNLKNKDSLQASISGTINGSIRKVDFFFYRKE